MPGLLPVLKDGPTTTDVHVDGQVGGKRNAARSHVYVDANGRCARCGKGQSAHPPRLLSEIGSTGLARMGGMVVEKGDSPGHAFHGNQYTGGIGGSTDAKGQLTLYRGEGDHSRPSYYTSRSGDAGGWWTTDLASAQRYAASTTDGKVYVIKVNASEAEQRGLPRNFFIRDHNVRERRRLYDVSEVAKGDAPGHEFHGNQYRAVASAPDAKGKATLTVTDRAGNVVWTEHGTRAHKATHVLVRGENPDTEGGAYWIGQGRTHVASTHTSQALAQRHLETHVNHPNVRGLSPEIVEVHHEVAKSDSPPPTSARVHPSLPVAPFLGPAWNGTIGAREARALAEPIPTSSLLPLAIHRHASSPEDDARMREAIARDGITDPITVTYNPYRGVGSITDGNHRVTLAAELGIDVVPTVINVDPTRAFDSDPRCGIMLNPFEVDVPTGFAAPSRVPGLFAPVVVKGDTPGHEFHGNQYTGGIGGGPPSNRPESKSINVDKFLAEHPRLPNEAIFEHQGRIVANLPADVRHEVLYRIREHYPPVDYIARGATAYRAAHSLPEPQTDISLVKADMAKGNKVAVAFEGAGDHSHEPEVRAAFADFKAQNREMWDFATRPPAQGGLGISVTFSANSKGDPYSTAEAQAEDLRANHHITIQSGLGGVHSLLSTQEYDQFRAVHDIFGHAAVGGGFDRHGEYQAWLSHMTMYTGKGAAAMSSEYHGVNSAMWGGAPGTPGTGQASLLPADLIRSPWDSHGRLVRKAVPRVHDDVDELIARLGLDSAFATAYERGPLHGNARASGGARVEKGEGKEHAFRGNQYTGGIPGDAKAEAKLSVATIPKLAPAIPAGAGGPLAARRAKALANTAKATISAAETRGTVSPVHLIEVTPLHVNTVETKQSINDAIYKDVTAAMATNPALHAWAAERAASMDWQTVEDQQRVWANVVGQDEVATEAATRAAQDQYIVDAKAWMTDSHLVPEGGFYDSTDTASFMRGMQRDLANGQPIGYGDLKVAARMLGMDDPPSESGTSRDVKVTDLKPGDRIWIGGEHAMFVAAVEGTMTKDVLLSYTRPNGQTDAITSRPDAILRAYQDDPAAKAIRDAVAALPPPPPDWAAHDYTVLRQSFPNDPALVYAAWRIRSTVDTWAASAGDSDPESVAVQQSLAKHFGMDDSALAPLRDYAVNHDTYTPSSADPWHDLHGASQSVYAESLKSGDKILMAGQQYTVVSARPSTDPGVMSITFSNNVLGETTGVWNNKEPVKLALDNMQGSDVWSTASRLAERDAAYYDHFVSSVYNNTQEYLKAQGVDEVLLYRGMHLDLDLSSNADNVPDWAKPPVLTVDGHPLDKGYNDSNRDHVLTVNLAPTTREVILQPGSSWSGSRSTAEGFASGGNRGYNLQAIVPRERVWSLSAGTGPGALSEREAIVLGGPGKATVSWVRSHWNGQPDNVGKVDTQNLEAWGIKPPPPPKSVGLGEVLSGWPIRYAKAAVPRAFDNHIDTWHDMAGDWIKRAARGPRLPLLPLGKTLDTRASRVGPHHDGADERDTRVHKGDVPGHEFHGNQYVVGTGQSKESIRQLIASARESGGFTWHPGTTTMPTTGFVVAVQGHSAIHPDTVLSDERSVRAVADYLKANKDAFTSNPAMHLGGWVDTEHHEFVLDMSEVVSTHDEAVTLGRERNQQAVWDIAAQSEVTVGGTGDREDPTQHAKAGTRPSREPRHDDRRRDRPVGGGVRGDSAGRAGQVFPVAPFLKGDAPGHDFHGNQYTGGKGGGATPTTDHHNEWASIAPSYHPLGSHEVVHGREVGSAYTANPSATTLSHLPPANQIAVTQHVADIAHVTFDKAVNNLVMLANEARSINPTAYNGGLHWYQEAHDIAHEIAARADLPIETAVGVIAALSPQTPWGANRIAVEEVTSLWSSGKLHPGMSDDAVRSLVNDHMQSLHRTYVNDNENPQTVPSITGERLAKAYDILSGKSPDSVLSGHKVRSFANNIADPSSPADVTVDTHAVSAAALYKYSAKDPVFKKLIGSGAGKGAKAANVEGTYSFWADAYRSAADKLSHQWGMKILPHQAQAVVWTHWSQGKTAARKRYPGSAR